MSAPASLRHRRWRAGVLVVLLAGVWAFRAQTPTPSPIVILVSLDGFRWDYLDRGNLPNLSALAARGVRADGLIPSYPTFTFPNHYTLATGLLPDHHGIVGNYMVDPAMPSRFSMWTGPGRDPRWWGGEPIWVTASRNGRRSATMFWPGAEARPATVSRPYDDLMPNGERVRQVLEWLALPEASRPSFITLMFTEADDVAHVAGPESAEINAAIGRLDQAIGLLIAGIARLNLTDRTTIVVVSDHGMMATSDRRLIFLDDYLAAGEADVVEAGANLALNPAAGQTVEAIYAKLAGKHPSLPVYRKADLPARLRYGSNPRVPAIVGIPEPGWFITSHFSAASRLAAGPWRGGAHGYDPRAREMQGIFVAAGPRLKAGQRVPAFDNIHVYAFLCALLNVQPAANDGNAAATAAFLIR